MPLVPERLRSRQDVKASIGSQFWEQPVHSTKSVDGQLWSLPCEPPALNLTGSSGLSRTQQLLAAQAVRVPFFPSYDGSSDGLVLDRVLAKTGGQRWWAALSSRIKAQRAYHAAAGGKVRKVDAVRDLSNYALCARGRFQLGRRLTLNAVVEAPDSHRLHQRLAQRLATRGHPIHAAASAGATADGERAPGECAATHAGSTISAAAAPHPMPGAVPSSSSAIPELEPVTAHATLRCVLPGHDLSATAGYNLQYVDSTGDTAHVPLAVSLDLASHDRQDGLQYRVGLHQVTAPLTEGLTRPGSVQRWRTSLHAQGAVAVEGEAHIWKAASSSSSQGSGATGSSQQAGDAPPAAAAAATKQPASKSSSGSDEGAAGGGSEEPRRTKLASAIANAAAADQEPAVPARKTSKEGGRRGKQAVQQQEQADGALLAAAAVPVQPAEAGSSSVADSEHGQQQQQQQQAAAAAATGVSHDASVASDVATSSDGTAAAAGAHRLQAPILEQFMRPLEHLGEQVGDMLHHVTHPYEHQQAAAGDSSSSSSSSSTSHGQELLLQRQQQAGGGGGSVGGGSSSSSIGSPRNLLGLSSGSVGATIAESVALLQQIKDSVARLTNNVQDGSLQRLSQQLADSRAAPPRRRPYSMLLSQPHLKLNAAMGCLARMPLPALRPFSFPHASLEPLDPVTSGSGSGGGIAAAHRHPSNSSLVSRASYSSQLAEAWQPYLKGTALRVFASAGVSGQLGRFTRPFLDYTAASARIDIGLTSPHVVGVVPDPATLAADSSQRPDKHRAFALEGRGAWHALSVSLAQQVAGPVRARLDARFALDPTSVPASEGERSTLKGVLQTVLSVRPSLLETVYGFDCVLPGTEGAARVAIWFSPKRRECMAELRLF